MKRSLIWFSVLLLLTGCGSIKVTRSMLKMALSSSSKLKSELCYADSCDNRTGIPYVESGDPGQVLDIYYADKGIRKGAALIDIHGGFYVAGRRENNRAFASVFLREGYDVVLVEYRLNDGKRDVFDELSDCAAALDYLALHASELGLDKDRMFLTGDSAGGHLALYMAEGSIDPAVPVRPRHFKPRGVLLNCPAYDFASFADSRIFAKSALEWFLGPRYKDSAWMASMSPRTHLGSYGGPLFVSTCTNDFIRSQSVLIKADCDSLSLPLEYVDISSDDRKVAHVHNVIAPGLPESAEVNAGMVAFMDACLQDGALAACKQAKTVTINPQEYRTMNTEGMQTVQAFLKETGYYFLATADGDQPQVRPFGTAEIIEGKLYIQTGHVKNVAKQIAANPKVAICAYNGQKWLRITATLVEDPRVEIKKAMLDANPGLRAMYSETDDNTAVYFLTDAKATVSSFTDAPIEISF